MPFPMKIQPVDFNTVEESSRYESFKPVQKSRFKRLFERQFSGLLRSSAPEKPVNGEELIGNKKDSADEFEPSSVCLAKMVQSFIEEGDDKNRCNRNRCNCFTCNGTDSSEEEADSFNCFGELNHTCCTDASEILKSLVPCLSVTERNVLADITKIIDKNRVGKRKDNFIRKTVVDGLLALGYDASICESRWEKTPSTPAGSYEYVDVVFEGERLLIDIDFRSEFEIARSTRSYKYLLQLLPNIFVGKADRLQKIVLLLTEAAKQSLKKKGMPCPPWRKAEYVKAKWLSSYTRITQTPTGAPTVSNSACKPYQEALNEEASEKSCGELSLVFRKSSPLVENHAKSVSTFALSLCGEESTIVMVQRCKPPGIKHKGSSDCARKMTGLTSLIEDNP